MSILINGMDMPDLDENTERLWVPGWIEVSKDGKAIFCTGAHFDPNTIRSYPIKGVSTPHGRLIDADKLMIAVLKAMNSEKGDSVIGLIEQQPTIIEAEGKS